MSVKSKDAWVRIIDVSDSVLHSKGYTLYKVTSKVFPKNSVEAVTEVVVWKRYNDFKKLHKALSTIHQNLHLKGTFPPLSKTRFFGRFEPKVIEERRQSALNLLQFAANSFPLFTSQIFVKFFEEGHVPDNYQQSVQIQESSVNNILQSQTYLQQSSNESKTSKDSSCEQDDLLRDTSTSLGGIWQHHQVSDTISLSSQCTDDDDRTTFTDDDSILSRPSLSIAEFDPLMQTDSAISELDKSVSNNINLCNSWLLSALETCNEATADKDHEVIPEYPTPFGEFDFLETTTTASNKSLSHKDLKTDSNKNFFTFELPTPKVEENESVISEFDPLSDEKKDSQNNEEVYVCDEFAMTPDAYQTETTKRPSYIVLAAKYVESAQVAEESQKYMDAFDSYKKAIEILLQGIQKDKCSDLKDAVRKKVLLYLMRAEELYENKLPKNEIQKSKVNSSHSAQSLSKIGSILDNIDQLNKYKVIGILEKTVLVLDTTCNETFVAKTLYKTSSDGTNYRYPIAPKNVPFMVKLHHIYESSYAIFLILEHATGGRLWNYVCSFFQRKPLSPVEDGTCIQGESKSKADFCNVYSGKKVSENQDPLSSDTVTPVDSDLIPSEQCPSSYIALFKKYADSVNQEDNVSFAKYHKTSLQEKKKRTVSVEDTSFQQSALHSKNIRNRLSSSTGSLEIGFSQKACLLDAFKAMDDAISQASPKSSLLPESCVVLWAAEIVLAFEHLHNLGIIWMDFHPNNILLGDGGHILLTYQSQWNSVDVAINEKAKENLFCAPEIGNIFPVTSDCDWWSLGAVLFELLIGQSLVSCHPTGITRHTILNFPVDISLDAKDFITKLLQYNPSERLGSGVYGIEELKSHPFFHSIDWKSLWPR